MIRGYAMTGQVFLTSDHEMLPRDFFADRVEHYAWGCLCLESVALGMSILQIYVPYCIARQLLPAFMVDHILNFPRTEDFAIVPGEVREWCKQKLLAQCMDIDKITAKEVKVDE